MIRICYAVLKIVLRWFECIGSIGTGSLQRKCKTWETTPSGQIVFSPSCIACMTYVIVYSVLGSRKVALDLWPFSRVYGGGMLGVPVKSTRDRQQVLISRS